MRLSTLVGGLSLFAMLLLASPGVRIERVPDPVAPPPAAAPPAAAPR